MNQLFESSEFLHQRAGIVRGDEIRAVGEAEFNVGVVICAVHVDGKSFCLVKGQNFGLDDVHDPLAL